MRVLEIIKPKTKLVSKLLKMYGLTYFIIFL